MNYLQVVQVFSRTPEVEVFDINCQQLAKAVHRTDNRFRLWLGNPIGPCCRSPPRIKPGAEFSTLIVKNSQDEGQVLNKRKRPPPVVVRSWVHGAWHDAVTDSPGSAGASMTGIEEAAVIQRGRPPVAPPTRDRMSAARRAELTLSTHCRPSSMIRKAVPQSPSASSGLDAPPAATFNTWE